MASINLDIWIALRSSVESLDLATQLWPEWPCAWPGSNYSPESGKPYLAIGKVTTEPRRVIINRPVHDYAGYLIVTPVMPLGQDPAVYENISGRIADHFTGCSDAPLTFMSASGSVAHATDGYRDGSWWRVPVRIPFRTWR